MSNQLDDLLCELRSLMSMESNHVIDNERLNRVTEKIYDYTLTYIALGDSPIEALVELKTLPKNESLNVWRERATGALEMYRCMVRKKSIVTSNELEIQPSSVPLELGIQQLPLTLSQVTSPQTEMQSEITSSKGVMDTAQEFIPGDLDL